MEIVIIMLAIILAGAAFLAFVLFTGSKGRGYGLPADTDTRPDPLAAKVFAAHVAAKDLANSVMVDTPDTIRSRLLHTRETTERLVQEIETLKEARHGRSI